MISRLKEVSVRGLAAVLQSLPEGSTVQLNSVGQLIVNDEDYDMLGYIELDGAARFVPVP